ncbi:leucine-rich repeat-containing G protein-coupled receptor 3 [Arctopsyche grandis]|uniref:leucine-rich repeat-containing G protein-coupled receptor 3 n=1 Tax=Arctopsyche grandis TaxID=121162 RepID=UPI00406D9B39
MKYGRSFLLGSSIVFIIIVISALVFYFSLGKCPIGSFSCDNDTLCVPQKAFCDKYSDCKDGMDENIQYCGQLHGSKNILNTFLGNKINKTRTNDCNIPNAKDYEPKCKCHSLLLLSCRNANLSSVPYVPSAKVLILVKNRITLEPKAFAEFSLLELLIISENEISNLPDNAFYGLQNLQKLYLKNNKLTNIEISAFENLNELLWLFLEYNNISKFYFPSLPKLLWLDLSFNCLTLNNTGEVFPYFPKIHDLVLSNNLIFEIKKSTFGHLNSLNLLNISYNRIHTIEDGAFDNLTNLQELDLSNNFLHTIQHGLMNPLQNLYKLRFSENQLKISGDIIPKNVRELYLDGMNEDKIDFAVLNSLKNLKFIKFPSFYYCSFVPAVIRCDPYTDGISDLKNLLTKPALRLSAWLIALITIIGNVLVLWGRGTSRDENRALSLLIRNLAVADMLMGIYLLVIGIQDASYRNEYHQYAAQWSRSWTCITIGTVAMISSEVSMLILVFMSVERFLIIVNPLGGYARLNPHAARRTLIIVWSIGITISILPIIQWRNTNMFYGTYSGMCFPLHLINKFPVGWQYSAFVFLGINSISLLLIASAYCGMFISVWRTRRAALPTSADCEFAVRFFFIVFTNAACWAPIIVLKILNFFNVEISADVYAWMLVFILPLNSAVNPVLYTFTTPKYRDHLTFKWHYSANRSSNGDTESSRASSNKNVTCIITKNNDKQNPPEPSISTINTSYLTDCQL